MIFIKQFNQNYDIDNWTNLFISKNCYKLYVIRFSFFFDNCFTINYNHVFI